MERSSVLANGQTHLTRAAAIALLVAVGSTGNSEYYFGSGGGRSDAGSIASGLGSLGSAASGELRKLQSSDPTGD